jgi:hypothetical protein
MANALFPKAKEGFATGAIDWDTGVIKASLVRSYTYDSTDSFVSDVTGSGASLHGTAQTLASKTATNGTLDAADVTFSSVTADANGHGVILYQSSAPTGGADVAASSQRVIAYFDTGTNLPVTPNGGDITVAWSNGADKIATI